MTTHLRSYTIVASFGLIFLQACSIISPEPAWKAAVAGDGPGHVQNVSSAPIQVSNLPKSRGGNAPVYHVFGQAYRVLDTAKGFREKGVASWYGKKFHGRRTSNGEIYDMYQLTAAHKHLPLPTFVKVTRQDTGQSVVVKVNDRGPFVGDRVIDLSFAAAAKLDMLGRGKADVVIEALSSHEGGMQASHSDPEPSALKSTRPVAVVVAANTPDAGRPSEGVDPVFLQVGAYSEVPNAQRMLNSVQTYTDVPAIINHDLERDLYRVRVGPLSSGEALRHTRDSLSMAGISSYTLVVGSP